VNLAQDFSPGTAVLMNDLVPEALLSPSSTEPIRLRLKPQSRKSVIRFQTQLEDQATRLS